MSVTTPHILKKNKKVTCTWENSSGANYDGLGITPIVDQVNYAAKNNKLTAKHLHGKHQYTFVSMLAHRHEVYTRKERLLP